MKVENAVKGLQKAGFDVVEDPKGTFHADRDGYRRIRFYRNGDGENIVDAYYLSPDYDPPYPKSLKQAIRWACINREAEKMEESEYRDIHNKLGCPGCKFEDGEKTFKGPCCTRLGGPAPDASGHCEAARYRVNIGEGEWAWVSVPGKEAS